DVAVIATALPERRVRPVARALRPKSTLFSMPWRATLAHERTERVEVPTHPVQGKLPVTGLDRCRDSLVRAKYLGADLLAGSVGQPLNLVDQAQPDEDQRDQLEHPVAGRGRYRRMQ